MIFSRPCPEPDCNPLGFWPGQPSWEGEIPDESGYATRAKFTNCTRCYYAGGRWLIYIGDSPTANNLEGILSMWKSDLYLKNPTDYTARVMAATGWTLHTQILPKSFLDAFRLLRAITIVENAGKLAPYKEWMIVDGLRKAGYIDVPKTPFRKNITKVGSVITVASGIGPIVTNWIAAKQPFIESLNNPYVTLGFGAVGMLAGGLTFYGAWRQAQRNAQ